MADRFEKAQQVFAGDACGHGVVERVTVYQIEAQDGTLDHHFDQAALVVDDAKWG